MLILAFDTATEVATSALVRDGEVLGERASRAVRILDDVDELLRAAGLAAGDVGGIAVGRGPGSYTGLRIGLVTARTLSFSLGAPVAGVSTLAALAAGAPGASPLLDGRRGEVFLLAEGEPACVPAQDLAVEPGLVYVGDGAVRHRARLEENGGVVPPDRDPVHVPWARHHAALARDFGRAEDAEPIYLRVPDAERALRA
ncbi:MAG TPA: tRNA (adenosine(37)-N6)-threonylcarbamoyltransferase complex dimerization subunit type 1 TsaB [Gaiellaceae bacterium]|nr:tRNA (adenosine(37)-N6)-threonylcarbamoyltransferase complex dimerization subunit type 1 TsaB [Gaiellaceae bacterium]